MLVSITIQVGLLCVQKQTGQQCSLQFTCWVMRKAVLLQPKQPGFFIESCDATWKTQLVEQCLKLCMPLGRVEGSIYVDIHVSFLKAPDSWSLVVWHQSYILQKLYR